MVKSSMWQVLLWIRVGNLNKNMYIMMKFNKYTLVKHITYEFVKWSHGLYSQMYMKIQMHFKNHFISRCLINNQYAIHVRKKTCLPKRSAKT
jgi:hypothetical protein